MKWLCRLLLVLLLLILPACSRAELETAAISEAEMEKVLEENQKLSETDPELEPESIMFQFIDVHGISYEAVLDPDLPKMDFQLENITTDSNGLKYYYQDDTVCSAVGVDVSKYQDDINWEQVAAAGIEFAIIRLGFRGYGEEGALLPDDLFEQHYSGAKQAGLKIGVYFFAQAIDEKEAREEAAFVIETLAGRKLDLPVVYDPEEITTDEARTDGISGEQFTYNCIAFCEAIKTVGYEPMIYANMIWEAFVLDLSQLTEYPLWYADYEPLPQTPYEFQIWQYSESGEVDGIEGPVDLNLYFDPPWH